MRNVYRLAIVLGFFFVCGALVTFSIVSRIGEDPHVTQARVQKELAKIRIEQRHLQRNDWLFFYGTIAVVAMACLCGLILSIGVHRAKMKQASVHTYRIANSEFVVHERDLSLAWPVASGLVNAEKLEKMNGGIQKAFELYIAMADVQTQQIKALVGHRGIQPALPPVSETTSHHHHPLHIPTFRELVLSGEIAHGKPLVFGYTTTGPKTGTWKDVFSNGTGGQSGSGKTSTLRSLIAQSVLQGVLFWIIDYHYPHPESLLATLGDLKKCPLVCFAENLTQTQDILDEVNQTIERRLKLQEPSTPTRVLCIDEVLAVVKGHPQAEETIVRIGIEGRKNGIFGLFAAQSWKADRINTTARDNLTSIFAHCMKPNQARPLLQDAEYVKEVKKLHTGQMLFCPVNGAAEIVTVPYCDPADMPLVAKMVNTQVNTKDVDLGVDRPVDQLVDPEKPAVDLVDRVNMFCEIPGNFTKLVESTGIDKGYLSKILSRKKPMSEKVRNTLEVAIQEILQE